MAAESQETNTGCLHYVFWFLGGVIVGALWRAKLLFGLVWLAIWLVALQLPASAGNQTVRWLSGTALLVWLMLRLRRLVLNSRENDGYAAMAWESLGLAAASVVSRIRRRGED